MVMKAKHSNKSQNGGVIEHINIDSMDGIVMVLFPVETWHKVQEISEKVGIETGAVISVALELMEDKILKNEKTDG
jgi:hypothetical protein